MLIDIYSWYLLTCKRWLCSCNFLWFESVFLSKLPTCKPPFMHNFCIKPYVSREPWRDPRYLRLYKHGIYVSTSKRTYSVPRSQWRIAWLLIHLCSLQRIGWIYSNLSITMLSQYFELLSACFTLTFNQWCFCFKCFYNIHIFDFIDVSL